MDEGEGGKTGGGCSQNILFEIKMKNEKIRICSLL